MGRRGTALRRPSRSGLGLVLPCIALGVGLCLLLSLCLSGVPEEGEAFVGGGAAAGISVGETRSLRVARNNDEYDWKQDAQDRIMKNKLLQRGKRYKGSWREKLENNRRQEFAAQVGDGFEMPTPPNPWEMFQGASENEVQAPLSVPQKITLWSNSQPEQKKSEAAPASSEGGGGFDFMGLFGGNKEEATTTTTSPPSSGLLGMFR